MLECWKNRFWPTARRGNSNIGAMVLRKRCEDIEMDILPLLTIIPLFQYSMDEVKTLIFYNALNST